jgi:hypothetical protein
MAVWQSIEIKTPAATPTSAVLLENRSAARPEHTVSARCPTGVAAAVPNNNSGEEKILRE